MLACWVAVRGVAVEGVHLLVADPALGHVAVVVVGNTLHAEEVERAVVPRGVEGRLVAVVVEGNAAAVVVVDTREEVGWYGGFVVVADNHRVLGRALVDFVESIVLLLFDDGLPLPSTSPRAPLELAAVEPLLPVVLAMHVVAAHTLLVAFDIALVADEFALASHVLASQPPDDDVPLLHARHVRAPAEPFPPLRAFSARHLVAHEPARQRDDGLPPDPWLAL
mmetsp:Transcript_20118/g.43368  ORF Transcript_20118/g.43368 Transcript_20118/m.43368 type:complete len:223 (-) Transcript_20118:1764-2432(-)